MKNDMQKYTALYNHHELSLLLSKLINDKEFREVFSGDNIKSILTKKMDALSKQKDDNKLAKHTCSNSVKENMGFDDRLLLSCYVGY